MNIEEINLVKKLVNGQRSRESIKSELISQGFSTDGFEPMYQQILTDLNMVEPPSSEMDGSAFVLSEKQQQKQQQSQSLKVIAIIGAIVIGLVLVAVVLFYAPAIFGMLTRGSNINNLSVGDLIIKSNVETTAASAHLYGTRMGGFDGVCSDITVVAPVQCMQTTKAYAVYAPISNNRFYCIDSTDFSGPVEQLSTASGSCLGG